MRGIRAEWGRLRHRRTEGRLAPAHSAVLNRVRELYAAEEFEQAEEGGRYLATMPPVPGADSAALSARLARAFALAAAVAHGRGLDVLPEVEALIADMERAAGADPAQRALVLAVRASHVEILVQQERYEEAESEARDILRAAVRIAHLAQVWETELLTLAKLAAALNGQGRHEEAEAIARGNLPRADGLGEAALRRLLVGSLNGQGRYEEALAETRRFSPTGSRASSGAADILTATALHHLGHHQEAEDAAHRAVTACEQSLHPDHPRTREARALLARLTGEDRTVEGNSDD
ncbi:MULTISPECIES: hypothetical protein [unclassified Streptomyces]|uniref:hypothetical protein n=1 Tax=unclassified Streptomyces TaxID=2593676 RepID=UPI00340F7115